MDKIDYFNYQYSILFENDEKNAINKKKWYDSGTDLLKDESMSLTQKESIIAKLIGIFPDNIELYYFMGYIFKDIDQEKALLWFQVCFKIDPTYIENILDYTKLLFDMQNATQIIYLEKKFGILSRNMHDDRIKLLASSLFILNGLFDKSEEIFKSLVNNFQNIKDESTRHAIYENMGYMYALQSKTDEAKKCYEYLLPIANNTYSSNKVLFYDYIYHNLNERFAIAEEIKHNHVMENNYEFSPKPPNSKINIGYVSDGFLNHAVSNFISSILKNHDSSKFNIFLFDNSTKYYSTKLVYPNCTTINIHLLNGNKIANMVNELGIDILIDLNGYTLGNRLDIFAKNPAPVQMTYIGYPNSLALDYINYRIVDHITDHSDSKQLYSEQLIKLPKCFLLFESFIQKQPVIHKPIKPDCIILGSLNKENKTSNETKNVWKQILKQTSNTKILIKTNSKETPDSKYMNDHLQYYAAELDTDISRIIIRPKLSGSEYIQLFAEIDILLDTFPYSGTTTSCNALYNSVPVITKYHKDYHSHNVTSSLLFHSGLSELVTHSDDEYIKKVVSLCNSPDQIQKYHDTIHNKFMELMNHTEFMRTYEEMLVNTYKNHSQDKKQI